MSESEGEASVSEKAEKEVAQIRSRHKRESEGYASAAVGTPRGDHHGEVSQGPVRIHITM